MATAEHKDDILIHAFIGGCEGPQGKALTAIRGRLSRIFGNRLTIVTLGLKHIKERDWNEVQFTNWLAAADIYLILCHPHQGTQRFWNSPLLYALLQVELAFRIGFPSPEQLWCPIFTQNKIHYLDAVPDYTLPTLRIYLDFEMNYLSDWLNIARFSNNFNFGCGWALKLGYATNSRPTYPTSIEMIMGHIYAMWKKIFVHKSLAGPLYLMLQPRMPNTLELKVVCWNKVPLFISKRKKGPGTNLALTLGDSAVMAYAKEALEALECACPCAVLDGLTRVDIFQKPDSTLVVNEFESLEADFETSKVAEPNTFTVLNHLQDYWFTVVRDCVQQCDNNL